MNLILSLFRPRWHSSVFLTFFSPVFQIGLIWASSLSNDEQRGLFSQLSSLGLENSGTRFMLIWLFQSSVVNVNYQWVCAYFIMYPFVSSFLSFNQMKQRVGWWSNILRNVPYYYTVYLHQLPICFLSPTVHDTFGTSKVVLTEHSFRNYDKIR